MGYRGLESSQYRRLRQRFPEGFAALPTCALKWRITQIVSTNIEQHIALRADSAPTPSLL